MIAKLCKQCNKEFIPNKRTINRQEFCCERCGICGENIDSTIKPKDKYSLTVDHIIPVSKGGNHILDNLQLAHMICNAYKSNIIT